MDTLQMKGMRWKAAAATCMESLRLEQVGKQMELQKGSYQALLSIATEDTKELLFAMKLSQKAIEIWGECVPVLYSQQDEREEVFKKPLYNVYPTELSTRRSHAMELLSASWIEQDERTC
eukprot:4893303-Ditylum_brightwellii.AAC.1